ncbi:DUF4190 domain-containing protein [Rothia sp. P3C3.S176]|uniref:DUF4190 domain-containing protein n=1 Tax=Rothia sp. P3C3.S176 TaxID=2962204 RepID=UPI0020C89B13|nr:DUF4190 domain-containing protein [Rothia sp. P3C3.S176]MCP8995814.1 DUF4190 domain-containing protein [Rothia sp. P3C3.S176]
MSQNPRGSDPYDYNPDYNRLNEQYNQNGQYGQNTQYGQYGQYGQNSYVQDSYGQNQYGPYGQQYQHPGQYGQPMMVPIGIVQKTPEQLAGEKAAQTSMVLGIISLACIVTLSWWLFGLPSLILGVIGIFKANEAERYGAAASAGRILNWISVAIGGMFLVLFGGGLLLAIMLALSDSAANSRLVETAQILALF